MTQANQAVSLPVTPFIDTYSDCYIRTVAAILLYYGCPHPALCFGQSYAFLYMFPTNAPPVIRSRILPLAANLKYLGIYRHMRSAQDEEEAWTHICANLQASRPILGRVDVYHIPYLPYYHKAHDLHNIIISGFDNDDQTVDVVDNVANYTGKLTRAELFLALNLPPDLVAQVAPTAVATTPPIHWQEFTSGPQGFQFQLPLSALRQLLQTNLSLWDQTQAMPDEWAQFVLHLYPQEIDRLHYGWQAIQDYAQTVPEMVRALPTKASVWESPFVEDRWLSQQAMWFSRYVQYLQTQAGHTNNNIVPLLEKIAQRWMVVQSVMVKYTLKPHDSVPEKVKKLLLECARQHADLIEPLQNLTQTE